jgi:photosystem II stability/assembly factor-like uncharacterized protein
MKKLFPIFILLCLPTIANSQWNTVSPFPAWGIYDVCFIDENEGWIYDGDILHTTDGGITWENLYSSCGHSFNSFFFINSQNGWLTGVKEIMKTTDGGKTWASQYYDYFTVFNSIYFTDELNGWAVGVYYWGDLDTYEEMVETHDGGITWESKGNINNRNQGEYTWHS